MLYRDLGGPPFLRLPIWSCTARSLPAHACHHARRCALTLSPSGPHRFTHPLHFRKRDLGIRKHVWLVCSLLHLSSPKRSPCPISLRNWIGIRPPPRR